MNEVSVSLHAAYHGCRMTNCDVINIRNIITSEGVILDTEIKRSPDAMKAAAILVTVGKTTICPDKLKKSVQVDKQELFMSSDFIRVTTHFFFTYLKSNFKYHMYLYC